jgi:hypothetical protein
MDDMILLVRMEQQKPESPEVRNSGLPMNVLEI